MSAHRLRSHRFRRTALALTATLAMTGGGLAAAGPAVATTPPPSAVSKLVASLEAQIAKVESNPQLHSDLALLQYELSELQYFIQADCAPNIVLALLGDWYGPLCPG